MPILKRNKANLWKKGEKINNIIPIDTPKKMGLKENQEKERKKAIRMKKSM